MQSIFLILETEMRQYVLCGMLVSILLLSWCSNPTKPALPSTPNTSLPEQGEDTQVLPLPENDMTLPTQANMYYIKLEDAGISGTKIWCDDSLISVPTVLDTLFASWEEVLSYVYKMQLGGKSQPEDAVSMLTTELKLTGVQVDAGVAMLAFEGTLDVGWACDAPRIQEQLTAPALQFEEISKVIVTINEQSLDAYLSTK